MEIFKLFGSILINSDDAEKSIQKTEGKAMTLAKTFGNGIKTAAKWGIGIATAAAGAATAVVSALLRIDESTKEYRENMGKLNTAWEAAGSSAELAKQAYEGLYGVIGDQDTATEAAQLMAGLATSTEDVAAWVDIAAGAAGKFGDALPINSLIEAANETAKTGALTGALSDALNWVGIQEDSFQEKLDACSTEQERNALITDTLSAAYQSSTEAFKANNAEVLAAREAQANLDAALGKLGGAVSTVKTALMSEFAPAIADIVSAFVDFTQGVDGAEVALQESVKAMVDKIVEKLPDFINFGIDVIVSIASGIIKNLPYLISQLPTIIGTIVEGLMSLGIELHKVGEDLFNQLLNGLKSVWDGIGEWVSEKVNWLSDKLSFWRKGKDEMKQDDGGGRDPGPDPKRGSPGGSYSHASGLAYVPYDNYPANLHRGESVLNATDTASLLSNLRKLSEGTRSTAPMSFDLSINLDGQTLARKTYRYNQREGDLRGGSLVEVTG